MKILADIKPIHSGLSTRLFYTIMMLVIVIFFSGCSSVRHAARKEPESVVHGYCHPDFMDVKEEFILNFRKRGEVGAACAVYYKGELVVDLWGGYQDRRTKKPWDEHTMVVSYSLTKGISAVILAMAQSRGYFDYDDPVSRYWPEFARNGKEAITIRQLLNHEAGLCLPDEKVKAEKIDDQNYVTEVLSRQKPRWEPGYRHGYHMYTLGFHMNEIMRRSDPMNRSIGQFLNEEVVKPGNLSFYIGLPDSISDDRIARMIQIGPVNSLFNLAVIPRETRKQMFMVKSYLFQSFFILKHYDPNIRYPFLTVEIPSANGVGEVRAIAAIYGMMAMGGRELGIDEATFSEITAPASVPGSGSMIDEVFKIETYYNLGFFKPGRYDFYASSDRAFGHPGVGGSFSFADPDKQLGYAYAMNKMSYYIKDDKREKKLRDAVYRCVERIETE